MVTMKDFSEQILNNVILAYRAALKEFFTPKNLYLTIIAFTLAFAAITFLLFYGVYFALDLFSGFLQDVEPSVSGETPPLEFETLKESVINFLIKFTAINAILGFGAAKLIVSLLFYMGFFGIVVLFSSVIATFFIGFFTPRIIKSVKEEHSPTLILSNFGNPVSLLFFYAKILVVFFAMVFLFIPLFFIPVVNIFATMYPFYYLFTRILNNDVASEIFTKEEFGRYRYERKEELFFANIGLYAISAVPIVGAFASVFYVLVITHLFLGYKSLESPN